MKRRRIVGKQPVALEAIVEHAPSAVVLADDAADNTNIEEEDADGASGPPDRFRFLHHKVIDRIVSALLKTKTDEELHTMTVSTLLKEVVGRSHGKVSLEEVEDRRDDFISASMELIPKMLAARLVDAVKKGSKAVEGTLVAPAEIDSQTKQKSYFITISGLPLSGAPSRDEVLDIMLASFKEGGYESSAYLSHVAVFREKHADAEKIHFHICACVSQRIRWVPWAKALRLRGLAPSFSQVVVEDPADHRRKQYSYMLRYCYLPTKRKPLETLDSSPLLWCHQGKHAPLIDAINGVLDAAGVRLDAEDAFLQRVAAGKKGAKRFTVTSFVYRLPFCVCAVSCSGKSSAAGYPKPRLGENMFPKKHISTHEWCIGFRSHMTQLNPMHFRGHPVVACCAGVGPSRLRSVVDAEALPLCAAAWKHIAFELLVQKQCHGGRESGSLLPA